MRSYGLKFIVAGIIIVAALAFLLRSSSDDSDKYVGGTLIQADEDSVYAFATDSVIGDFEDVSEKIAIYAYAENPKSVGDIYDSGIQEYINDNADSILYVRKPKV